MKIFPNVFPSPFTNSKDEICYVEQLAQKIKLNNKSAEHYIGLYTDNNAYMYYSIAALWMLGCAVVPLNHKFPKERLQTIMDDLKINTVVCNSESHNDIHALGIENIIHNDEPIVQNSASNDFIEIGNDENAIAYVLFTSGSTGVPKGIPISFGNLKAFTEDIVERTNLKPTDKVLQTYELSFDLSIGSSMMAWASGATLYTCPMNGIIPLAAVKMIMEHKINIINMAPSTVNVLRKYRLLNELNLPFVDMTIFGGEAVSFQAADDWGKCTPNGRIINAYGPTEATIWATYYTVNTTTEQYCKNGLIPIGKPAKYVKCHLHKSDAVSTLPNQGELWLGGKHIFNGYVNNIEKNKQVLTELDGEKYYRTGDLVELQDNGDLIYLNRLDNQVKISGFRVEPGEVEHKIKQILNIGSCAVIPITESDGTTWLLAVVEKDSISDEEKQELQNKITFYMFPRKFITVNQMPLNHSGKIDRQLLKSTYGNTTA